MPRFLSRVPTLLPHSHPMRRLAFLGFLSCLSAILSAADTENVEASRKRVSEWLEHSGRFTTLTVDFVQERQLRALRRPLSRTGKLWITQDGRFRWQIEEPPTLLLTRAGKDAPVLWIDAKNQTWQRLDPGNEKTQGNAEALRFLLQAQAPSLASFEETFTVRRSVPVAESPGRWRVELDLKDRRASLSVKDVFFEIEPTTGALHLMEFQLRDGSLLRTRMTRAVKNASLEAGLFEPDLSGLNEAS